MPAPSGPSRTRLAAPSRLAVAIGALVVLAAPACSNDDPAGDAERFCGEVADNRDLLVNPPLTADDDPDDVIASVLDEYRRIRRFAPLAIATEWDQVTAAYETADTVEAGDPESEQQALEAIFRAESSAVAVADWLRENCGVELGPLATIAGSPPPVSGGANEPGDTADE